MRRPTRLARVQRLGYNPRASTPPSFHRYSQEQIVKQLFAVIALFAAGFAFADRVPPGTNDEISARLKPAGELCKAGEACGQATAADGGRRSATGEAGLQPILLRVSCRRRRRRAEEGQCSRLGAAPCERQRRDLEERHQRLECDAAERHLHELQRRRVEGRDHLHVEVAQ